MHTEEGFLLHSEQKRRLGPVSLFSIVLSLCLPLTVFIIIPFSLASLAGPSTLVAIIASTVILLLVVLHSSELSCSVPRSFCSLHISLSTHGSLLAALLSLLELVDSLALAAVLAKATAAHTNVLFRDTLRQVFEVEMGMEGELSKWLFDTRMDLSCVFVLFLAFLLMSGSLKVVGTVSFCLLVLSSLVVTSCSLVAFFHADPINWVHAPFFSAGLDGVLKATCSILAGLRVPSLVISLLDDTWQPRKRAPLLLPLLSLSSALFSFLVALTFSLCINVSRIPDILLLPNVFHTLNVPAARYMLTVASVCGLWGALLGSLLPGSRLILTVSSINIFPLGFINGSQQRSLCLFFCLLLAVLPIKTEHLIGIISLAAPMSMLCTVALTISQHYGPRSIGLQKETCRYRRVKEREPLERRDETANSLSSFASSHRDSDTDSDYESLPLRTPAAFTAASYNAAMSTRTLRTDKHNCLAHACGNNNVEDGHNMHLYSSEMPELPYYGAFVGGVPHSESDAVETADSSTGRKASFLFAIHLTLSVALSLATRAMLPLPWYFVSALILALLLLLFFVARSLYSLPQSAHALRVHHRVPLFPFSSLFASLAIVFALTSTDGNYVALVFTPMLFGGLTHVFYSLFARTISSVPPTPLVIVNTNVVQRDDELRVADDPSSLS